MCIVLLLPRGGRRQCERQYIKLTTMYAVNTNTAPPCVAVKSGLRGPHARAIAHARRRATVHTLRTGCTHTV